MQLPCNELHQYEMSNHKRVYNDSALRSKLEDFDAGGYIYEFQNIKRLSAKHRDDSTEHRDDSSNDCHTPISIT